MKKNKKIAAIYIRVSTDAQFEEGYSVDAQKEQLAAYCISKGIKNYEFYIDGGWSGSNINRPEMHRLIKDAKDEKLSHCIVYKLDRLSRSQKDTLYLIEDVFNPHNVDFVSLNESMDTSTPMGRLMLGILSAFAQLERENIRERTRMGMKERVKSGYWMGGGRIPYGYDYDKEKGILVPNKDAEKVKKTYELYIKGYSAQNIANMLGLKYERLAIQILKRKSNYGIIEYNGIEYQGKHEPIISKETYDLAMDEMVKRSISHVTTSDNLLTGLVYCGHCGAKMRYQKWGKKGSKFVCYSQQKSKPYLVKDENCTQEKVWTDEIEYAVITTLFKLKEKEDGKDKINTEIQTSVLDVLNQQQEKLEKELKKLYNLYSMSDDDILLETIEEKRKKLNEINQKIKLEIKENSRITSRESLKSDIVNLESRWEYMTKKERQSIIRCLVKKVIITDDKVEIILDL